ncbi:MAG TPA: HlyD family efflux transporter periplasmic adaptor subunit [Candidatus Eisenbacteria bacterium]|nr:HlyD family efflux transporter periplasmic adaptor subunit [Candidatus Eisenbacteria bacterium]
MRLAGAGFRAALLAAALAAGCGHRGGDGDAGDKAAAVAVHVRVATVAPRAFADLVGAPGQWRSAGDITVAAPFAAVVESLGPRVGDRVEAGRSLGVLVTRESRAALRGAELLAREAHDAAARAEAEQALALARRDLVRVPLPAPRSGVVARRGAEMGAEVAEGAELLAITPDGALVFEAHVPAADASRVRAGQRATITGDGVAPREATVQRVLPAAGAADQSTLVWLQPAGGPPPAVDRFGTAAIQVGPGRTSLAVPAAAVVEDDLDGRTRVAVVGAGGEAVWTEVQLGAAAGPWRELRGGGLAAGARVVVEGQRGLPDHAKVVVAP